MINFSHNLDFSVSMDCVLKVPSVSPGWSMKRLLEYWGFSGRMSSDIPSPKGAKRKTVTEVDVVCALKGQGRTLYGFGVKLFRLLKAQQNWSFQKCFLKSYYFCLLSLLHMLNRIVFARPWMGYLSKFYVRFLVFRVEKKKNCCTWIGSFVFCFLACLN